MIFAVFGLASLAGAVFAPFLLHDLVKKAASGQSALGSCIALAVFGLAFCLWLLTVFNGLPAA